MFAGLRRHLAGILPTLLLALVAAPSSGLAAEEESAPAAARRGPPEEPGQPDEGGLERSVARQLARLDERLGFGTFPNGSPLWPARMAAAIDYLVGSVGGEGELAEGSLLRRLAADLRGLGVDRGLGGPPEDPGRPPVPPGKERAERLRRVLETVRLLHEKLDPGEAQSNTVDRLAPRTAPANDNCGSAQAIGAGTFTGSTTEATNDGSASCGSSSSSPDVWYVFTAPAAGAYTFDTFGSSYDTVLSLQTSCAGASEIACNDDADGTLQSKLGRAMAAGESVWVRVSGFSGARGAYTLNVSQVGGISGAVTRRDTGDPLAGVRVQVFNSSGWYLTETTTASDGSYSFVSLSPGTHYLRASRSGFIGELYDDIPCPFYSYCWPDDGTPVTVGAGTTEGIDFDLAPAASLSGIVTDAATTDPLAGYVYLFDATGNYLNSYYTGSGGTYEVTELPAGDFYLQADAWGYRSELYDDVPCGSSCDPTVGTQLAVSEGTTFTGIDFALDRYPSIEGILTEEDSGEPIEGQEVDLYTASGNWTNWTWSGNDGSYRFGSIAAGTYFVRTLTLFYLDELYDDIPCEPSCTVTSGTGVEAILGSDTTGVNFTLMPKGAIAGTLTEAGSGTPLPRVQLEIHDEAGSPVTTAQTNTDGTYLVQGLSSGTYYVRSDTSTHLNEVYDDFVCDPFCDVKEGMAVTVVNGTTTSGIDFVLRRLGAIRGRVTESLTGAPIGGAQIEISRESGILPMAIFTAGDGTYEAAELPSGTYYVGTRTSFYRDEAFDDVPCEWSCDVARRTPVEVQIENTNAGIDFVLDRLGFLEGRVTEAGNGQFVNSRIYLFDLSGDVVAWEWTFNGNYRFENLQPRSYYVKTDTSPFGSGYQDELFADVPCDPTCDLSLGAPVPVQLNGGVVGVNFALGLCPGNSYDDLVNTYIFSTFLAEACERVSATAVTVGPGADVTFKAGRTIVLGDGFKVEAGASFRAVIEPAWSDD